MFNLKITVMILSQDLDYLFGEGHRRFAVYAFDGDNEEVCYHEELKYAQEQYTETVENHYLHSASLAVVIDDTDGDPFSNGSGYISLLEAVADVTQIATGKDFYSGDSRNDIQLFIQWAIEFEKLHLGVKWGEDEKMPSGSKFPYSDDYMEAIEKYTEEQIFIHMKEDQ